MWWISFAASAAVPADVADAVKTGDCASVLAALPSPDDDDERLVVGRCLRKGGRPADAADLLAGMGATGPLASWGRYERARALADAGRPASAIEVVAGLSLPGDFGLDLRVFRDRLLVESRRSAEARDDLRALLDGAALSRLPVADEARWWLGRGAEERGDLQPAIDVYRTLWSSSTRGGWAEQAAGRLAALGAPVPDLATPDGRTLARTRIGALRKANLHKEALELLLSLRVVEPATTRAERLELARQRADARDYPGARDAYAAVLGAPDACEGAASELFAYALTTARAGDYATAAVVYRRLEAAWPRTDEGDFASFKLGYMAYDEGDLARARAELTAHLSRHPDSKHGDEALWFGGRAAWRLGDLDAAETTFASLLKRYPNSVLAPGAAYWRARVLGRRGDAAGERTGLEEVLRKWPVSGHAYSASILLERRFPSRPVAPRPAWPAAFGSRADVVRAEALLAVGFVREASAELAPVVSAAASAGREASLAAAHAFIAAGDYGRGKSLAAPFCVWPWSGGEPVAQQACTPMPEASIIARVAERYGLDPLVPYGIMTAESSLDPTVTSAAGARGLMQLMPAELPRIHAALFGEAPVDPDDLYSAPYNAAMGTTELGLKAGSLGHTLTGTSAPAVIASYNAGEEAVRRWLATYPTPPAFDEFAEDVGYTETRQYVRRVLGFVMAYRWVYGDPEG